MKLERLLVSVNTANALPGLRPARASGGAQRRVVFGNKWLSETRLAGGLAVS